MPEKILILRFSSIGDIILTSPVIRCIKEQKPDTELHYATKSVYYPLLKANPRLSKIHLLEHDTGTLIRALQSEKFDRVIDLHHNLRTARIKISLGIPSHSFYKANIEKWLMVNFKMDRLPDLHIVDRYLAVAGPLGVKDDGKGLDYFIPEEERQYPESVPPNFREDFIAFAIGAKYPTKQLPPEQMIRICKNITRPVILLGGEMDQSTAEKVRAASGKHIWNGCGVFNLNQSAFVISQANRVITHDTGLMHMAAAFQKEVISVWGNTIPGFGMYPYFGKAKSNNAQSHIFEVNGLPCRPCSKIGYQRCPKKHFKCMRDQNVKSILKLVNK